MVKQKIWADWLPVRALNILSNSSNLKNPTNKSPRPDGFAAEFYKYSKNSFHEASITLIPKPDKDTTHKKRKLQPNIPDVHRIKNPQQNISK